MRQFKINKHQITIHDDHSVSKYLNEIGKIALITAEEETTLVQKIKEGDHQALQKLIRSNLRFVVSVAKQFHGRNNMTLGDLINEGNLGLMKAATRFDETKGFKFISYAVWWIRQSIMQAMSEQARIVRLPMNRVSALNKISKTYAVLEQQFQREPSLAELSETLSLSEEQVSMDIGSNGRHISLDAPFIYNEESSLGDILPNNNEQTTDFSLLNDSLKDDIRRALAILSPREVEVVSYYFGLNDIPSQTLEEIGSILNLTRERVRQIKQKAIFRLKGKLYNSYINEGYLV